MWSALLPLLCFNASTSYAHARHFAVAYILISTFANSLIPLCWHYSWLYLQITQQFLHKNFLLSISNVSFLKPVWKLLLLFETLATVLFVLHLKYEELVFSSNIEFCKSWWCVLSLYRYDTWNYDSKTTGIHISKFWPKFCNAFLSWPQFNAP